MNFRYILRLARCFVCSLLISVAAATMSTVAAAETDPLADRFGGPFTLQSEKSLPVSDTDFRGRFMLVAFGYTHCPDICPATLSVLTAALDALGPEAARIQPIFITLDPARDTAEKLAAYHQSFHPSLIMLTGPEPKIAAVAKAYRVHRRKFIYQPDPGQPPAAIDDYAVDHGSLMYLMGPDGKFRTLVTYGTSADKLAAVLRKYVGAN